MMLTTKELEGIAKRQKDAEKGMVSEEIMASDIEKLLNHILVLELQYILDSLDV
jgi:hypothetical protein